MQQYVVRRLLMTLPTLLGITVITFFLIRLAGDPTDILLPPNTPEAARAAFRAARGLDQPLWMQFLTFCSQVLTGDFGMSLRFDQPAGRLVVERLGASAELALAAMAISLVVGLPAGVIAAHRRGSATDTAIRATTLIGQAVPSFYLGILAIIVFAVWLRMFPVGGRGTLAHLVLPATTLALHLVALIARVTRSCMLDVLRQDYVRTARAKGMAERTVIWVHALRNAFIPVLTVIGLQFGLLLSGVVVAEIIFSWPGIGRLAVQAIYSRDFPVVQAVVFLLAVIFVLVNLIVDLLYAVLDPRISYRPRAS